jgi:hypothetical protein
MLKYILIVFYLLLCLCFDYFNKNIKFTVISLNSLASFNILYLQPKAPPQSYLSTIGSFRTTFFLNCSGLYTDSQFFTYNNKKEAKKMKKICVKVGVRNNFRLISANDLSKIYYVKKRATPKLPKFSEE